MSYVHLDELPSAASFSSDRFGYEDNYNPLGDKNGEENKNAVTEDPHVQRLRWGPDPDAFLELRGFQLRRSCLPFYATLCCVTLGLSWAVLYVWRPLWRVRLLYARCPLSIAGHVTARDSYGRFTVRAVTRSRLRLPAGPRLPAREVNVTAFEHQGTVFVWDEDGGFQEQRGLENLKLSCKSIVVWPGWTSQERSQLITLHGNNVPILPKRTGVPMYKAFKSRLGRPQYVLLFIGTFLHFLRSRLLSFLHASAVILVATFLDLFTQARARRLARSYVDRVARAQVRVVGLGAAPEIIPATMLVPGDRYEITSGLVPCDSVLVSGSCFVTPHPLLAGQAPLRREALTSREDVLDCDPSGPHRQSMLLCGCDILPAGLEASVPPIAVALRTGAATELSRTLNRRLHPRPMPMTALRRLRAIATIVSFIAAIIVGTVLFLWLGQPHSFTWDEVLLRALSTAAVVIPPSLPLASKILSQRARNAVPEIQCPYEATVIPLWGLTTTVCLDAPGTVAPSGERLFGAVPTLSCEALGPVVRPITALTPSEPLRRAAALCPDLYPLEDGERALGAPLDVGAFAGSRADLLGSLDEVKLREAEPGDDVRLRPLLNPFWSTLRLRELAAAAAADETAACCTLRHLSLSQVEETEEDISLPAPLGREDTPIPRPPVKASFLAPAPDVPDISLSPTGDYQEPQQDIVVSKEEVIVKKAVTVTRPRRRRLCILFRALASVIGSSLGNCLKYLIRVSDPHDPPPASLTPTLQSPSLSSRQTSPKPPSISPHTPAPSEELPSQSSPINQQLTQTQPQPDVGRPDHLIVTHRFTSTTNQPWKCAVYRQHGSPVLHVVTLGDPFALPDLCHCSPSSLPGTVASLRERGLAVAGVAEGQPNADPSLPPEDGTLHPSGLLLFAPPRPSQDTLDTINAMFGAGLRVVLVSSQDLFRSIALAESSGIVRPDEALMVIAARPPISADRCARIDIRPASGDIIPEKVPRIHYALTMATLDVLVQDYPDLLETVRTDISVYAAAGPNDAARAVRVLGTRAAVVAGGPPLSQAVRWAPGASLAIAPEHGGAEELPSLAAPLVSTTIRSILNLLRVGRATLETRVACIRFLLVVGSCRAVTELLLGTELAALTDSQAAYLDTTTSLVSLLLTSPRPPLSLSSSPVVPDPWQVAIAAFAHCLACVTCQASLMIHLRYFLEVDHDPYITRFESASALFGLSGYQTCFLAIWALGGPPRRSTVTSRHIVCLTTAVVFHTAVILAPVAVISSLISPPWLPNGSRMRQAMLIWAAVSLLLGATLELVILPGSWLRRLRRDFVADDNVTGKKAAETRRVPLFGTHGRKGGFEEEVMRERQKGRVDGRKVGFNVNREVPVSGLQSPSAGHPRIDRGSSPVLKGKHTRQVTC
ncbi:uncharacterized protein LOC135397458 [Ornithodoros turicata]|uniref:uncharacterized protein LOC135397458 n=1 Tax=Ornithodoros turicata TaxID=34597 RepID=UPI003138726F